MLNSNEKPILAYGGIVGNWRIIAFVLILFLSISSFIYIKYDNTLYNSLFFIFTYVVILFFDRGKISIDHEKVSIIYPIFKPIIIQKKDIKDIKSMDNENYGTNWLFIIIIFLFILFEAPLLFDMIFHPPDQERIESFIASFISTFFSLILISLHVYRRSHYSKYLTIDAGNKKIYIYPETEDDFEIWLMELKARTGVEKTV